jgi:nucleotide sugar dehydrogenase
MHVISLDSSIELFWNLLNQQATNQSPNRIVFVKDSHDLIGIITDSDIRRFIAKERRLPATVNELVRDNFVQIHEKVNRNEMLVELHNELSKRNWTLHPPILDVVVRLNNGGFRLDPFSNYANELTRITDEYVVIGMGYIGLTLLAVLGYKQLKTVGIEKNLDRLKSLRAQEVYVHEPLLEDYLKNSNSIEFVANFDELNGKLLSSSGQTRNWRRVYIVAVNTPLNINNNIDFTDLNEAIISIVEDLQVGDSIILRSTLPVGSSEKIAEQIHRKIGLVCGVDFFLGFAPERTIEGNAILEIENLPQIVSGVTRECLSRVESIAMSWATNILSASSCRAAELAKLATNSFRDYYFAFANEMAMISQKVEVDINEVITLANKGYPRSFIPKPSPGVGGPCLSKDSHILLHKENNNSDAVFTFSGPSAILAAREINAQMPGFCVTKILDDLSQLGCHNPHFHILGLAFKGVPETTDTRNSPSVEITKILQARGFTPSVWDSNLDSITQFSNISLKDIEADRNVVVIIGNNNKKNLDELLVILQKYRIAYVFDPWEIIRESGNLVKITSKGIPVLSISSRFTKVVE